MITRKIGDLAMEWDGETSEAILHVNGHPLRGLPSDVEEAFHALVHIRDRARWAEESLKRLRDDIALALRRAE